MKVRPPSGREPEEDTGPSKPSLPDESSTRRFKHLLQEGRNHRPLREWSGDAGDADPAWPRKEKRPRSARAGVASLDGGPMSPHIGPAPGESRHRPRQEDRRGVGEDLHRDSGNHGEEGVRPGERILATLGGSVEEPVRSDALSAQRLGELAQRLAERILVAPGDGTRSREVRIKLKDSILPGTEIVLERKQGGVEIRFHVGDPGALPTLDAQLDGLRQMLETRLGDRLPVSITIREMGADDSMQNDGRSRNRCQYQEDSDET